VAGWTFRDGRFDLVAGLTLAAITIPEQMATARLGGFAPEIGFFAFIAAALAFAVFGAHRLLSVGADSTITPIFAGGLALLATAGSPHYAALAAALALLVGLIVCCGGVFRLGWIADLLSVPVTTGFLAGIAVHIAVSQLPGLLGLPAQTGSTPERIAETVTQLGQINPWSAALGIGVFLIIFSTERISARIPGALVGLVAATAAVVAFGLEGRGVEVLGTLPSGLPQPTLPAVSFDELRQLVSLALIVALVVMVQTAATSRSFPSPSGAPPEVNRDFIGVGAGSILAGLFGAFPVNASPPRTAILAETGGRSQVAALIAAAIVLALALLGGRLLSQVPHAALAGVLVFVAQRIIRVPVFVAVYRQAKGEFALIVATAVAIVVLPIQTGVAVGIGLSVLHGVWSTTRARPIEFEKLPDTSIWWPPAPGSRGETRPDVAVIAFQAPLSFLNAGMFEAGIGQIIDTRRNALRLLVLEASSIIEIDYSAARSLAGVIDRCRAAGITFAIARLESVRAQQALSRFGILAQIGPDHVFRSVDEAVRALAGAAYEG
jgi:MFS superfamily sulfate permease-like transporter